MHPMEQPRSKTPLIYIAVVLILGAASLGLLTNKCSRDENIPAANEQAETDNNLQIGDENHPDEEPTPEELIGKIQEVVLLSDQSGNAQPLIDYLRRANLSQNQIKQLKKLAASSNLKLDPNNPVSKVDGHPDRWSLNLADGKKILVDLVKAENGLWQVKNIILPDDTQASSQQATAQQEESGLTGAPEIDQSALIAIKQFLNAIKRLDAAEASKYIDQSKVSYATLAGLCIVFEEGEYALLKEKTLRKMFLRDTSSGWLVRLESLKTDEMATFSITSKREDVHSPWLITEINLDGLLADYAARVLDGDIHYSPLIKNPQGGDTLAVYFDLDARDLTTRTKRQLAIVADLLKTSADKKLIISGHTDALGSDPYNLALSQARAEQVMLFLSESGIDAGQMKMVGYGKSQPRLPNTTPAGDDSPEGRRANRRAEILLDF